MAISITLGTNTSLSALSAYNAFNGDAIHDNPDFSPTPGKGCMMYDGTRYCHEDYWTEVYCVNTYIPVPPVSEADFDTGGGTAPYMTPAAAAADMPGAEPFVWFEDLAATTAIPDISGGGYPDIYAIEDIINIIGNVNAGGAANLQTTWLSTLKEGALGEGVNPLVDGVFTPIGNESVIGTVNEPYQDSHSISLTSHTTNHTSPSARFVPLSGGLYTITLSAWDAAAPADNATADLDLYVKWRSPQPLVLAPAFVAINTPCILDASSSVDSGTKVRTALGYPHPNPNNMTFEWTISSAPANSNAVFLEDPDNVGNTAYRSFTPDVLGDYKLIVTAFDSNTVNYKDWAPDLIDTAHVDPTIQFECVASLPDFHPQQQFLPETNLSLSAIASFGGQGAWRTSDITWYNYAHWEPSHSPTQSVPGGDGSLIEGVWQPQSVAGLNTSNVFTAMAYDNSNSWTGGGAQIRYDSAGRCIYARPGSQGAVMSWKAPYAGKVKAVATFGDAEGAHSTYGDGVDCYILSTDAADGNVAVKINEHRRIRQSGTLLAGEATVTAGEHIKMIVNDSSTSYDVTNCEMEVSYIDPTDSTKLQLPAGAPMADLSLPEQVERTMINRFAPEGRDVGTTTVNVSASEVIKAHVRPRLVLTSFSRTGSPSNSSGNSAVTAQIYGTISSAKSVPGYWTRLIGGPNGATMNPPDVDSGITSGENRGWKYVPGNSVRYAGLYGSSGQDWFMQIKEFLEMVGPNDPPVDSDVTTVEGVASAFINTGIRIHTSGMYYCWVAREVYGPTNPKWLKFRRWMLTSAPETLREYYINHGPEIAEELKKNPLLKETYRDVMDGILGNI
jgi:hypothetical protein